MGELVLTFVKFFAVLLSCSRHYFVAQDKVKSMSDQIFSMPDQNCIYVRISCMKFKENIICNIVISLLFISFLRNI